MIPESRVDRPAMPRDRVGPVFSAPWQARIFGISVALRRAGLFGESEWASVLGAAIAADARVGRDAQEGYYLCWLDALEFLLESKQVLSRDTLTGACANIVRDWPHPDHVARREPITVSPGA